VNELEQIIVCPHCEGKGWTRWTDEPARECCVCETRGRLVIDAKRTMEFPAKKFPNDL